MSRPLVANPVYGDHNRPFSRQAFGLDPKKAQNLTPIIVFNAETKASASKGSSRPSLGCFSARNGLKMAFIGLCVGMCLFQTIDIVKKYSSFPMDVNVVVEDMKLLQLPAITLCNNNVVSRKLLFDFNPDFQTNDSLEIVAKMTKEWIAKTPLWRVLALAPEMDGFVTKMECDTQSDPKEDTKTRVLCGQRAVFTSLQKDGICFTYFHRMAAIVRPKRNRCRELGTCSNSQPRFDTNEIVRFELNFAPENYTSAELPVSGRISIHDSSEIGNSLSNAFNLEPGFYYQMYIKKQSTQMLRAPYQTNCLDYGGNTTIMSRNQCAAECTSEYTLSKCFCWPPELPYRRGNARDVNRTLKWCIWRFKDAPETYGACWDRKTRMRCSMRCQASCWTDHYELSVQKLSFEYYGRPNWRSNDEWMRAHRAVVSVRYWTSEHTIHRYSAMFALLDMFCYVGGLVSMYTGVSLIALYDFFIFALFFAKKKLQ